ncbi:PTS transporter subunit EIIC [Limosilactobacillus caecicola]|uniref:PTS transporter subunit EIIC n=1 Tax=Limosilactobacillus caecicola TaxID=2941332 RepID=UPI00203EAFFB|nr:PTS transporter subunit EIIC [Limosilactobacillus caecicola]
MNTERIVDRLVRFRQRPFIRVLHRTLITLFPLIVVGAFARIGYENLFSGNGFLGSILHVTDWLPFRQFLRAVFSDVQRVTVGWSAPFAAMVSAMITTRIKRQENILAGITAAAAYVLIFVHGIRGNSQVIEMRYYSVTWLIIGIIVGYLVGRYFAKYGQQVNFFEHGSTHEDVMAAVLKNMRPVLVVFIVAFILHIGYASYRQFNLDGMVSQWLDSLIDRNSNYFLNILLSLINTVLVWLGFAEPLTITSQAYSNEVYANLTYALTHKTSWHIPYPFTPSSLYTGFAVFGGVGLSLALVIGILWAARSKRKRTIAKISIVPSFFNLWAPILFGAQVFLNPAFLLPFVILPIFNILVGSFLIFIHAIPPMVYPVPNGTPGILIPFISTGGNWVALLITIVLLIIDIILYIPFIKLAERVDERSVTDREEESTDEKAK